MTINYDADALDLGWYNYDQAAVRYEIVNQLCKDGDVILDVGAGLGNLGIYLMEQGKRVNYFPMEPDPKFFQKLQQRFPQAIQGDIFFFNFGQLRDILPADLVVASGVIAELNSYRKIRLAPELKEKLFIQRLLSIPSRVYFFDIWDKNFFKRNELTGNVRVSDPGTILQYVEENLKKNDELYYIRPLPRDPEASYFIIIKK